MGPVLAHYVRIEQLDDCSIDICHIADLNDAMAVADENQGRLRDHHEQTRQRP